MTSSLFHFTVRFFFSALLFITFFSHASLAVDPSNSPTPSSIENPAIQNPSHHLKSSKGTITAITPSSLTILSKKTNTSHTFKLSPETNVVKNCDCDGKLSDLTVGQHVKVKFSPDDMKASHVHIWKHHKSKAKDKSCSCTASERKERQESKN